MNLDDLGYTGTIQARTVEVKFTLPPLPWKLGVRWQTRSRGWSRTHFLDPTPVSMSVSEILSASTGGKPKVKPMITLCGREVPADREQREIVKVPKASLQPRSKDLCQLCWERLDFGPQHTAWGPWEVRPLPTSWPAT